MTDGIIIVLKVLLWIKQTFARTTFIPRILRIPMELLQAIRKRVQASERLSEKWNIGLGTILNESIDFFGIGMLY